MSTGRSRGIAVAGAILVALAVVGFAILLNERGAPEDAGEAGADARVDPTPSRRTRTARPPASWGEAHALAPQDSAKAEGVLEVEVFSGDSPLPGARIQLHARAPADMKTFPARWKGTAGGDTGTDGRWVSPVPPGSYLVTARAQGLAPAHATVVHPPGTARTPVRLRLEAGAELRGFTLVKGTGDPVSLAEILLTPHSFPIDLQGQVDAPEEERFFATSSESGEFHFSGLAPGRYHIEARAPGYASKVLPSIPIPFRGSITLDLTPGGLLEGVVIDGEGWPASGAEVLAFNQAHDTLATTDTEGSFSFEVPPGSYTLSARRGLEAGALDAEVSVAVGQRVQGLRLRLGAGARVSGTVVRPNGSPVLGARVELRQRRASFPSGLTGTDASGAFSLQPLAAGTYDVSASSPGGAQLEHGPLTLSAGEHASLTLTLPLTIGITVEVIQDWSKRRPLKDVLVRAIPVQGQSMTDDKPREGRTDARGLVRFSGLAPGMFRVEVWRDPTAPAADDTNFILIREVEVDHLVFLVRPPVDPAGPSSLIEGRILERSGNPPRTPVLIEATSDGPPRRYKRSFSDAQGRFRLAVPPGTYTLKARRQQGLSCGFNSQSQLQVNASQDTQATILLEEAPPPDLRLQVVEAHGAPSRLTALQVNSGFTQTDERGLLEFCLDSPGSTRSQFFPLRITTFDNSRGAVIEQDPGQRDVTVELLPLASVRGRVMHMGGAPVRRSLLEVVPEGAHASNSPQAFMGDQFELSGVPPGRNQLVVTAEDGQRAAILLDMRPGESAIQDITVYPGVSLTGRLVDATTGAPLSAASVGIPGAGHTTTSEEGRFTLHNMPAGQVFLYIDRRPSPGARSSVHAVRLLPGQDNALGDVVTPSP